MTQVRIYNLETGVELTGLTIEEKCGITSMFISQDQRHLLLNLAQQRIHLHELGDPATNTPSPTAGVGPVQKYVGTLEQKGRFVVRSCLGGINQAFVLSGSEDNKVRREANDCNQQYAGWAVSQSGNPDSITSNVLLGTTLHAVWLLLYIRGSLVEVAWRM